MRRRRLFPHGARQAGLHCRRLHKLPFTIRSSGDGRCGSLGSRSADGNSAAGAASSDREPAAGSGPDSSRESPFATLVEGSLVCPRTLIPSSFMPSYRYLFEDPRGDDLVAYLHDLGGESHRRPVAWHPSTAAIAQANSDGGQRLFQLYCTTCHGGSGHTRGTWRAVQTLPPQVAAGTFTRIPASDSPAERRERLATIVKFGLPGRTCPVTSIFLTGRLLPLTLARAENRRAHFIPSRQHSYWRKLMKIIPASFLMTIPLLLAPSAFAQHQTLVVDPAASGIAFTLGDVLHSLHGTFHLQSGTVDFESGAPKISGIVAVPPGSGESGNESRDQKQHKDVLDVSRFANVTFAPKSYQGTIAPAGDSTIQVTGAFTLHGTQHELTVPMQIHIEKRIALLKLTLRFLTSNGA